VKSLLALTALGFACIAACASSPPPSPRATVSGSIVPAPPTCNYPRPACAGNAPRYEDVLPLLKRRCFACHAGDGMAVEDHDFSKPSVVHAQKSRIGTQVGACAMPPRQVPLAPADAQLLMAWATCASEGQ
jgi:hypothetical protein